MPYQEKSVAAASRAIGECSSISRHHCTVSFSKWASGTDSELITEVLHPNYHSSTYRDQVRRAKKPYELDRRRLPHRVITRHLKQSISGVCSEYIYPWASSLLLSQRKPLRSLDLFLQNTAPNLCIFLHPHLVPGPAPVFSVCYPRGPSDKVYLLRLFYH